MDPRFLKEMNPEERSVRGRFPYRAHADTVGRDAGQNALGADDRPFQAKKQNSCCKSSLSCG